MSVSCRWCLCNMSTLITDRWCHYITQWQGFPVMLTEIQILMRCLTASRAKRIKRVVFFFKHFCFLSFTADKLNLRPHPCLRLQPSVSLTVGSNFKGQQEPPVRLCRPTRLTQGKDSSSLSSRLPVVFYTCFIEVWWFFFCLFLPHTVFQQMPLKAGA